MSEQLDQYKTKLINSILLATSGQEVQTCIDMSIKTLQQNNIDTKIIGKFVEMINQQLHWFSPMNKDPQQWSNITVAKVMLYRWKRSFESTLNTAKNV